MKMLKIDYEYYQYPDGFDSLEEFIQHLNKNHSKFIPFVHFLEENCRYPYFIQEDMETVYLNVSQMDSVGEVEVTVLSKEEYNDRLRKIVASKCVGCAKYEEDSEGDNLEGHRTNISLDGECYFYEKAK